MLWLTRGVDWGILVIGINVVVGFGGDTVEGRGVEVVNCVMVGLFC